MSYMPRSLNASFRRDQRGMAALEFALASPILLLLLLGGIEMARYMMLNQKTEKVAYTVADLVGQSQSSSISTSTLSQLLVAATEVVKPYPFGASGRVIVTSVTKTGTNAPTVRWQYAGGGTFSATSRIGAVNSNATLPSGFTMADKDNIIITEVFYAYTTLFGAQILSDSTFYKTAFFKPRLGDLTDPPT